MQTPIAPARRRSRAALWILLAFWIVLLGLAAGVTAGLVQIYRSDKILMGVTALGLDLGHKTPAEAAAMLHQEWRAHRIILDAEGQRWTLTPDQIGVILESDAMARAAHDEGRPPLAWQVLPTLVPRLLATSGLLPGPVEPLPVAPIWRFERDTTVQTLRKLAAQIEIPVRNAEVRISEGRPEAIPAVTGRAMDITAVLVALETTPWETALARTGAAEHRFTLPIVEQPPVIADVSAIVEQLRPLLADPITVRLYDAIRDERLTWTATPTEMGSWVTFEMTASGPDDTRGATTDKAATTLTWKVDSERAAAWVAAQNAAFNDERYVDSEIAVQALSEAFTDHKSEIKLSVAHGEREHAVKAGETLSSIAEAYGMPYPWLQAANPGIGDSIFIGDRITIPSPDKLLPLPAVENKRIKISIKNQKMQAYENGAVKWDWVISTGLPSSPTSPGVFQVQTHEPMAYAGQWDLYMPWFMGIYHPAPGQAVMNGFHGFPSRDRVQLLWTRNLGHPVTYGCILLSTANAKLLYDWAEAGVVVEITP